MSSRRNCSVPSYRLHKQSGQAVVTLTVWITRRRKDYLLGRFGTGESRIEYARVIAQWEFEGQRILDHQNVSNDLTINELAVAFLGCTDNSAPVKDPEFRYSNVCQTCAATRSPPNLAHSN